MKQPFVGLTAAVGLVTDLYCIMNKGAKFKTKNCALWLHAEVNESCINTLIVSRYIY